MSDDNFQQALLFPDADESHETAAPRKARNRKPPANEHQPPNHAKPIKVSVPDLSDPARPKTCLEVDFPIVPINALLALEGNAGKPIYQMSKWWARRRGGVFRAMSSAAAMEAPRHGTMPDRNGEPDESEAHKAVSQSTGREQNGPYPYPSTGVPGEGSKTALIWSLSRSNG